MAGRSSALVSSPTTSRRRPLFPFLLSLASLLFFAHASLTCNTDLQTSCSLIACYSYRNATCSNGRCLCAPGSCICPGQNDRCLGVGTPDSVLAGCDPAGGSSTPTAPAPSPASPVVPAGTCSQDILTSSGTARTCRVSSCPEGGAVCRTNGGSTSIFNPPTCHCPPNTCTCAGEVDGACLPASVEPSFAAACAAANAAEIERKRTASITDGSGGDGLGGGAIAGIVVGVLLGVWLGIAVASEGNHARVRKGEGRSCNCRSVCDVLLWILLLPVMAAYYLCCFVFCCAMEAGE